MNLMAKIKYYAKKNDVIYFLWKVFVDKKSEAKIENFQERCFDLNSEIYNTLVGINIKYISLFGTLLGNIRDGGVISYDDDFDFGIFIDDVDDLIRLKKHFEKNDFNFIGCYKYNGKVTELIFRKYDIDIDFFVIEEMNSRNRVHFYYRNRKLYYDDDVSVGYVDFCKISEIKEIKLRNTIFYVPKEYKQILNALYGNDWSIKKSGVNIDIKCGSRVYLDDVKGRFYCKNIL